MTPEVSAVEKARKALANLKRLPPEVRHKYDAQRRKLEAIIRGEENVDPGKTMNRKRRRAVVARNRKSVTKKLLVAAERERREAMRPAPEVK